MRLFAAVALLVFASAASADDATSWETYRTYLTEPSCGESADQPKCELKLMTWKRNYLWALRKSYASDLAGRREAQFNILRCFADGCGGDVKANPMLACAWSRLLIMMKSSPDANGTGAIAYADEADYKLAEEMCADSRLTESGDRSTAEIRAGELHSVVIRED